MPSLQKTTKIKSFLKWAGGKSSLLDEIISKIPQDTTRFIEPFAGSMVVSLNVNCPNIIINDTNIDLINLYITNACKHHELTNDIKKLFTEENNNVTIYNSLKNEFNKTSDKFKKCSLFVYLNRHCFNGLCRYNSKGEFNVPFGKYATVNPPIEAMKEVSEASKLYDFYNADFEVILNMAQKNDCFYCDPPYLPYHIDSKSNFTQYAANKFDLDDHVRLITAAKRAAAAGATVIISNHSNDFIDDLYTSHGATIHHINVKRSVSAKGDTRKKVRELLAIFAS